MAIADEHFKTVLPIKLFSFRAYYSMPGDKLYPCLVLILVYFLMPSAEPHFTTNDAFPKREVFCKEKPAIFINCTLDIYPPAKYFLYHNNELVRCANSNGSFDVVLNTTGISTFTCVPFTIEDGFRRNKSLHIFVKEPPQINNCSIISKSMTNGAVIEGDWVNITCNISGSEPLNITWSNGKQVWNERILTFQPVSRNDSGTYNIDVSASIGGRCNVTARANVTLNVYYGPELTAVDVFPKGEVFCMGKLIHVNSTSDANPPASYSLYRNNELLRSGSTNGSFDVVLNTTGNNTYTCVPYNIVGFGQNKSLELVVREPPQINNCSISSKTMTNGAVIEGDWVNITCNIFGSEPLNITWSNGKQVWNERILTFQPVSRKDSGTYNIDVGASHGGGCNVTVQANVTLNVYYGPELTAVDVFPKGEVFCMRGNLFHINCTSDANPPASYSLYRNNELVCSGSTNGSFDVVLNTTGNNTYTCVPYNIACFGQNKSLQLVVKEPPQINNCSIISKSIRNGTVIEGDQVIVTCNISGSEPLNIIWSDGKQVWNERILKFQPVSRNDSGTYTIDVKANHGGECKNTVKANVTFDVYYLDEPKVIGSSNKSYSPSNPEVWFNISVTAYPYEVVLSCETSTLDVSTVISTYDHSRINMKTFIVFVIITLPVESANITCHAKRGQVQRQKTLFVYKPANSSFDCELLQKKENITKAITSDIVLGTLFALSLLLNILLVVGFVWFRRKESKDKLLKRSETNKESGGHLNEISLQDEGSNSSNQQAFELSNVVPEYETVTPRRGQPQPSYAPVIKTNDPNRQRQISHQERQRNPNNELPNNQPLIYQNIQTQPRIYSSLSPLTQPPPKNTTSHTGEYQALQKKSAPQHYQSLDVHSKC